MFGKVGTRFKTPGTRLLNIVSVGLVGVGVVSWIRFIDLLRTQTGRFVQTDALIGSIGFLFLASQLTTVGVAFYAYSLFIRRKEDPEETTTTLGRIEALFDEQKRNEAKTVRRFDRESIRETYRAKLSRVQLLALAEGVGMVLLYAWLVTEFQSNIYMQDWAKRNAPFIVYLLNYYILALFLGLLLGFLLFQFRPSRRSKEGLPLIMMGSTQSR